VSWLDVAKDEDEGAGRDERVGFASGARRRGSVTTVDAGVIGDTVGA
jgi:hypothetical protein